MRRPTSEDLLARAAEADVPEVAIRLRREAAAAREDELRRALDLVAAAAEGARDQDLIRLAERVGTIFGAILARLHGTPRLEALQGLLSGGEGTE